MSLLRKIIHYSSAVWTIYQMMSEKVLKRIVISLSALTFAVLYFSSESLPKDKFIPSLIASVFGYLIFFFVSELFNKRIAFTAFLLFVFSPSVLSIGNSFNFTMGAVMLYTLTAFCVIWLINDPSIKKFIVSGIIIGITPVVARISKTENIDLPTKYLFEEPLALHLISLMAVWLIFLATRRHFQDHGLKGFSMKNIRLFAATHGNALILLTFAIIFLLLNQNSYIYALPLIFFLIPYMLFSSLNQRLNFVPDISFEGLKTVFLSYTNIFKVYSILAVLIIWYVFSSLLQYPDFAAYTNILTDLIP